MSCPIKQYAIRPEEFTALVEKAAQSGLVLDGTSGTASLHGCTFEWHYDATAQSLQIVCTGKPFYISCDLVYEKLDELITA